MKNDHYVPDISVVILTYNSSATIKKCLDSLDAQIFKDFEVIIVDDNSTDNTLAIVKEFSSLTGLSIRVVPNGSHNISKGRNIGLKNSTAKIVAYLDSDDWATPDWTDVIMGYFTTHPDVALISGPLIPAHENTVAKAISTNDIAIRDLFGGGILSFITCNCAINRNLIGAYYFNELFTFAEDLEFASRVEKRFTRRLVEDMKIHHTSRTSFLAYFLQMLHYGEWKIYFGITAKQFRPIDFVPLAVLVASIIGTLGSTYALLLFPLFCLLETVFVIILRKVPLRQYLYAYLAWLVKNLAWTFGVVKGLILASLSAQKALNR